MESRNRMNGDEGKESKFPQHPNRSSDLLLRHGSNMLIPFKEFVQPPVLTTFLLTICEGSIITPNSEFLLINTRNP
jgi:hypothetical protein